MQIVPIGTIFTPFKQISDMPIQPCSASGVAGQIILKPELIEGLQDLTGFSHIIVLYQFHQVSKVRLSVTPFLDSKAHGIFATRAPTRPNPIGMSVLQLNGICGNILEVESVDMLDGTPLLDIKPYVPDFDHPGEVRTGWLQNTAKQAGNSRSDNRFR